MKNKNSIQRFTLSVILLLQISIVFSQSNLFAPFDPVIPIPPGNEDLAIGGTPNAFLYAPDNSSHLAIKEKSDFKLSFTHHFKSNNIYQGNNTTTSSFKIGYSPISNLYATASFLTVKGNIENIGWGSIISSNVTMGDIGIGGYYLKEIGKIFKKDKPEKERKLAMQKRGILVNGLLGYSRGKISHEVFIGDAQFNLNRFYGQVGFDFQRKFWGIAGSAKAGILNYGKYTLNGNAIYDLAGHDYFLSKDNNYAFGELNLRVYLGIKYGQVYINRVSTKTDLDLNAYKIPNYWNVGVMLDLQEIFKKKK